ncbi:MAG: cyclic pyranopterin monophosphate synthase MoaC [Cyclobacteriaceae bacterium]|nr:cyclic pyranopterin monophosphate synthase MoaC [Cyclobacteriaceae bacterium]
MKKNFSHLTKNGEPTMVNVSDKGVSHRIAIARSRVILAPEILEQFQKDEIHTKKGPVFQTAILAGIMASKKTSELIPLCHPLGLDGCNVTIELNDSQEVEIICTVKTSGKTGVEMEALTGASVAALTIYDMCKGFSHHILIKETRLLEKTGGKNDFKIA